MFSKRQIVGFAGVIILGIGVFAPIISAPILGNVNSIRNGQGDGIIVLLLAVVSGAVLFRRAYRALWFTGGVTLAVVLYALLNAWWTVRSMQNEVQEELAGNPFAALGVLAAESVQLQWGWAALILGSVLVLVPAAWTGGEGVAEEDGGPSGGAIQWATVGMVAAALAVGFFVGRSVERSSDTSTRVPENGGSAFQPYIPPAEPTQPVEKWEVSEDKDPLDDSETVVLRLESDEGRSSMLGRPIVLILRCKSTSTEAFIAWNDYLGDEARVTARVGQGQPETARWSMSTDNQATFYPNNDVEFVKSLMEVDRFVARTTPYNESPVTAVFDVRGLSVAAQPLRAACNW